jgi:hypothetical protein
MKHQEVKSSNLHSVLYDAEKKRLEVVFKNGSAYQYHGVSSEEHAALMKADSHGKHFMKHIRPKYEGKKK